MKRPVIRQNTLAARDRSYAPGQRPELTRPRLRRELQDDDGKTDGGGSLFDADFVVAARYHRIVTAVANDQRRADRLSEVRRQLIYRFAASAVIAEQIEARLARGEKIDVTTHVLICNAMVRIGQMIGLDRQTGPGSPRLADLLRSRE